MARQVVVESLAVAARCRARSRTLANHLAVGGAREIRTYGAAICDGTQDTIGRVGEAIVQRKLNFPPTLTIRPGFPVRVMVTRDLILEPHGDAR